MRFSSVSYLFSSHRRWSQGRLGCRAVSSTHERPDRLAPQNNTHADVSAACSYAGASGSGNEDYSQVAARLNALLVKPTITGRELRQMVGRAGALSARTWTKRIVQRSCRGARLPPVARSCQAQ